MAVLTIDERVSELAKFPRQLYEEGRNIGTALELVLLDGKEGTLPNFYKYDWSKRQRESEEPVFAKSDSLTNGQPTNLSEVYKRVLQALIDNGYFVEEKDANSILLQPLTTTIDYIKGIVDNHIQNLRGTNSPLMERPKVKSTDKGYREWLTEYHRRNGMGVPPSLQTKSKRQLMGMFMGITEPARIEQWLKERKFVEEFYKAHSAMLPLGFKGWGEKQTHQLYEKLNRWYGTSNAQPDLFRA